MGQAFRQDWLSNTRGDLLYGLVVALALILGAAVFSIIVGVDTVRIHSNRELASQNSKTKWNFDIYWPPRYRFWS